jgi:DNA repair protein RadC
MSRPDKVADWFIRRVGPLAHEELWVLSLDGRNGLRGARRVSQGGLHGYSVAARDILRAALADAASKMVLIHNHPSGDPDPSVEDIVLTRTVSRAAAAVGTPLTDHVIIS